MLPLVDLEPEHLERLAQAVPGGAGNIQDVYPLAPLQEGILFHHMLREGADPYLIQTLLEFPSRAHLVAFIEALQQVIDRHDSLRTAVLWEYTPQPVQVVYRHATLPVNELALHRDRDLVAQLRQAMNNDEQRLALRHAPLMRLLVASGEPDPCWYACLQVHHLVCDAISLQMVIAEVMAILAGREQTLPEPIQYRAHVAQMLARDSGSLAADFFRGKLSDFREATAPFGLMDVHGNGAQTTEICEPLDCALAKRLRLQARRSRVSAATLFHAIWSLVVAGTTGQSDLVFGTVLLGRFQAGAATRGKVGMFLNTLPLRLQLRTASAAQLVEQTQRELFGLLSHEQCPLALAQRCSGIPAPAPLFTTLLNYRYNTQAPDAERLGGAADIAVIGHRVLTNFPIAVTVDDVGTDFVLTVQADERVDPRRLARYIVTAAGSLVAALEETPQVPSLQLTILAEQDRSQVLESFNATHTPYSRDVLVHQLFEAQVVRTPTAVALAHGAESLTYAQLNGRANQLAHYLTARGVGPGDSVGVCMERGSGLVVSLLGVLKAGAAYIPLDPGYPMDRIRYIAGDACLKILLTEECLRDRLTGIPAEVVCWERARSEIERHSSGNSHPSPCGPCAGHLAYVIYTSGSTGNPKGVMVEHASVVNFLQSMATHPGIGAGDCLLAVTTICFDIAALEIYLPLVRGAKVVLASRAEAQDVQRLSNLLDGLGVTVLQATPATWKLLLDGGWRGRPGLKALCGGEALTRDLAGRLLGKVQSLWNMYGPTETTIWSCCQRVQPASSDRGPVESIGRPIANTRVYILDPDRRPVPVEVAGEIYIAGAGVARGYFNRPNLTATRFLPDSFSADHTARMYRTGDLGRWRADGTLEYLGRNDTQVKLRGFRIELGEIEALLGRHPAIKEAIVVIRDDTHGEERLVAYAVCKDATQPGAGELRTHLLRHLPDYMIPSAFVLLDAFPLTPNGKIDRRALPEPAPGAHARQQYEPPQGPLEELLAKIWSEVLSAGRCGRHDNFFELGGHSLLGIGLIRRVAEQLAIQPPLVTIFEYPTIRQMARLIEELLAGNPQSLMGSQLESRAMAALPAAAAGFQPTPRSSSDRVPLTFSQRWLWDSLQLEARPGIRTLAGEARLLGPLDVESLRQSFVQVVRRHEALRTRIVTANGIPEQRIDEVSDFRLERFDLSALSGARRDAELGRLTRELLTESFGVDVGPLFAARLFELQAQEYVLIIALDHLICDRASVAIAWRDLFALYGQASRGLRVDLPRLSIQFADYAVWQQKTDPSWVERHAGYWSEHLAHAPRVWISSDAQRSRAIRSEWVTRPIRLATQLSAELRELSRREQTTPAMSLFTAYAALVMRWSHRRDVVMPFLTTGRLYPEVENTIGCFGSPLYLRIELREGDGFRDLLGRVVQEYATAYGHEDACRVAAQRPTPGFAWNPIFSWAPAVFGERSKAICALEQSGGPRITIRALEVVLREEVEWEGELRLDLEDTAEGIAGSFWYRADRLPPDTWDLFESSFMHFVATLTHEPCSPVATIACPR